MSYVQRPNPVDLRAIEFKTTSELTPELVILREWTPISQQEHLSSCAANAVCDGFEIAYGLKTQRPAPQLSRRYLYWTARSREGTTDKDEGVYIFTAFMQMHEVGCGLEEDCPYDTELVFEPPSLEATIRASENRISSFKEIRAKGDELELGIQQSLSQGKPVVFGTLVGDDFRSPLSDVLSIPTQIIGGHAMIITGYAVRTDGKVDYLVRNSHGPNWGKNGHIWFNSEYIRWQKSFDFTSVGAMNDPI